jgi:hypothetical protein
MHGAYGCGCGCGGNGGCGDSYGSVVRMGYRPVNEYSGLVDWPNYKNVNNEMYASCPDYMRAVDAFSTFREKATALYGEYPRADVWVGGSGKKSPSAKEPKLRSERDALRQLRALESKAKLALQKCKGAAKSGGALPDADAAKAAASLQTTTQSGGGNMLLYVGAGLATLAGLGLLIAAKRRKKAE